MKRLLIFTAVFCLALGFLAAQDGFGFGDSDSGLSVGPVRISGEVKAEFSLFPKDFDGEDKWKSVKLGDIFSGALEFGASGDIAEGMIRLKITPVFDGSTPVTVDEGYVRAFLGPVTLEGGLRKLTWGKADSEGPLDVINPIDYTDLTITDQQERKISRPLFRAAVSIGDFTTLEGVFVPWFQSAKFDTTGRWTPSQFTSLAAAIPPALLAGMSGFSYPERYDTLEYAQAGLRFTTTVGPADFGVQYYYGRLTRPAVNLAGLLTGSSSALISYNPYHQIGLDYAQVIAGFNLRAEAALNLTDDTKGDDPAVYNPAFAWSLGFDRDILWGINLNLQCNESLRFFHDKVDDNSLDIEAGSEATTTRITAVLSRKFFRDEVELQFAAVWGVEDSDCLLMPAVIWTRGDLTAKLAGGIFTGEEDGEMGQYWQNGFIKTSLKYTF